MHLIDLVTSSPVLLYEFFPEFNRIVGEQFRDVCHAEIKNYHASTNTPNIDSTGYAAINCLHDSNVTDSATLINYAGTGVLLGLLPTILSIFGSNTWETALLSTRRPVLSFLLALGAPVVTPARLFDSIDPREFLEPEGPEGKTHFSLPQPKKPWSRLLVLIMEYVLALAAIVNVTSIALELSMKAVSIGIAPVSQRFHWLLWTYIAAAIHLFGLLAFCGRLSPTQADRSQRVIVELQLCSQAIKGKYQLLNENLWSFSLSTWVSFLIVGHIIYGTALFSTTQLVLGADALEIIARYMASAVVCRAVLVFELHGLRDKVELAKDTAEPALGAESSGSIPLLTPGPRVDKRV